MTTLVLPSVDANVRSFAAAMMNRYGSLTDGWVQPSGERFIADQYADFDDSAIPFGGFEYLPNSSSNGSVVFDSGEAVVGGAYLARDETTAVDLNPNSTDTYYLGYSTVDEHTIMIGRAGAFSNSGRPDDPRVPIYDIETGNNGAIESTTDLRETELRINVRNDGSAADADHAEDASELGGAVEEAQLRSNLDANSNRIYDLILPSGSNHAATKGYVDGKFIPSAAEPDLSVYNSDRLDNFPAYVYSRIQSFSIPITRLEPDQNLSVPMNVTGDTMYVISRACFNKGGYDSIDANACRILTEDSGDVMGSRTDSETGTLRNPVETIDISDKPTRMMFNIRRRSIAGYLDSAGEFGASITIASR